MVETAAGLSVEQVLLEAKNYWLRIKQTSSTAYDPFGSTRTRLMGFTAYNAIKKLELEDYPGDKFWQTADWSALERGLIRAIDADLKPDGSNYEYEMLLRDGYSGKAARLRQSVGTS